MPVPADLKRQFEAEAARLNLTPAAYLLFLMTRGSLPADEGARLDRHVKEVFGKNGDLMRRLAK